MPPLELKLEITPRARLDVTDVRARAAAVYDNFFDAYTRCLYYSHHTTAGYLPQSLAVRLNARAQGIEPYIDVFRTVFPQGAGYLHDALDKFETEEHPQRRMTPDEWIKSLKAWASRSKVESSPSDEALRRDRIYDDRI